MPRDLLAGNGFLKHLQGIFLVLGFQISLTECNHHPGHSESVWRELGDNGTKAQHIMFSLYLHSAWKGEGGGQANQAATLLSPEVLSSFIVLLKEPLIRRTGPSPEPDVGAALTFCLGRVILSELFQKPKTILIKGHLPGLPAFDWGLPLMITFIEMERKERWVGKNGKGNNNNNSRPGKVKETDVAASALDQRYRMEAVHSIVLAWFDLVWPFGGGRLWGGTCTDLQHCHHMVLVETSSRALLFLSSSSSLCRYISSVDKYK